MKTIALNVPLTISRPWWISTGRIFNTALDLVFYDTGSLSENEQAKLSAHTDPLGSILVVHPAGIQ